MKLYNADCLEVLKTLPDNSVDAIITDPPYGLSFMSKKWDYDVPSVEIWEECLRVLKPGGYLLAFAGTRTQHRMAVRIEDAGFEIRDMIAWVYGSGFPKSLNIGKAVDKLQGNEREWICVNPNKVSEEAEQASKGKCQSGRTTHPDITIGTSEWEGWGTALKPALEPITVARKPLSEKTVAENCLKWGVGGINIDGCRVEGAYKWRASNSKVDGEIFKKGSFGDKPHENGRFPANLIHDGSDEVVELFPNNSQRFFYCAKASKKERGAGNSHCTVKPIALMEYLVKLVSREGHTILDPFAGSGTTGIACKNLSRHFIGCELDEKYFKIAEERINNAGIKVKEE